LSAASHRVKPARRLRAGANLIESPSTNAPIHVLRVRDAQVCSAARRPGSVASEHEAQQAATEIAQSRIK
jgi:hypothetical protein